MQFWEGFSTFNVKGYSVKNLTNHPLITLMLIWLSIDYTRPGCKIELEYTIHQLNLNPTDFVPLGAALTQFLCISICVYQWVLDCSSGLKGKAGVGAREGGRGSQYYYRLHCPSWLRSPGPRAEFATYPLSVLVRLSALWPGHCPGPGPPLTQPWQGLQ